MTDYKVALDIYNGPLDLLLFLIKRDEIEICDIPIARITEQYLSYVAVLREIDPETVAEFLVLAATLMEIKSRMLLPRPPASEDDDAPVGVGLAMIDQVLPFQCSISAWSVNPVIEFPTATQLVALAHDTPVSALHVAPAELGLATTDQLTPFQRSVSVRMLVTAL